MFLDYIVLNALESGGGTTTVTTLTFSALIICEAGSDFDDNATLFMEIGATSFGPSVVDLISYTVDGDIDSKPYIGRSGDVIKIQGASTTNAKVHIFRLPETP